MIAKLCLTFGKYNLTNLIRIWTSVSGRGEIYGNTKRGVKTKLNSVSDPEKQ